jgi:alkanesulfonate monooxygenase SsuD/methylene tetrahydromethanopterin reductase-like flavin-dependent oxidoreductase (luciferase family)
MTHWFSIGLDALKHKTEVLERHCEKIGRDPSTIERTVGAPVIVTDSEAAGKAFLERLPPERRPFVTVGTPEQAAHGLRPYLEAGFTGFTFNNNLYRTPDQIARIGELLQLVAGETPVGAR